MGRSFRGEPTRTDDTSDQSAPRARQRTRIAGPEVVGRSGAQRVLDLVADLADVDGPHPLVVEVRLADEGLAVRADVPQRQDDVGEVHAVEALPPVRAAGVDLRVELEDPVAALGADRVPLALVVEDPRADLRPR